MSDYWRGPDILCMCPCHLAPPYWTDEDDDEDVERVEVTCVPCKGTGWVTQVNR